MTERDIQLVINSARSGSVIPNIFFFNYWECDILHITRSGHFHEFEIKLSRSDFKRDLDKPKHVKLRNRRDCPVQFWYVCPAGLIRVDEVPDYAGLAYIIPDRYGVNKFVIQRQAPRAKEPRVLQSGEWEKFATVALERYWSLAHDYKYKAVSA